MPNHSPWTLLSLLPFLAQAQPVPPCSNCAVWNTRQEPLHLYGNTYYVGTHGLSSILITSKAGHVLIDGALPESAPLIAANIRTLGFRIEDVKLIANSHAHFDHAGGIAALQRLSGARVVASPWSAPVMKTGAVARDDPQFGIIRPIAPIARVEVLHDAEDFQVGDIVMTAHLTPGHTPGGTSWTWTSCQASRCLHMVYADSITAVSAPQYKFGLHPGAAAAFEKSFAFLDSVACDILLTPHPDASGLWDRVGGSLVDPGACRGYVANGRESLKRTLASETK